MNRKDLHDILSVCLDINEFTPMAAFFEFAGHCNMFDVRVCVGKEKGDDGNDPDYSKRIYNIMFLGSDDIGAQVAEDLMALYNREIKREQLKRQLEELDNG